MRNPKFLKTGPEFYKTQIYLENYLLILTNIQTWVNYRLYSQDLANLVQENIGFNFKTVYQMFRFRTRFLPESRKSWRVFLIILCLILYGSLMLKNRNFKLKTLRNLSPIEFITEKWNRLPVQNSPAKHDCGQLLKLCTRGDYPEVPIQKVLYPESSSRALF